MECSSAASLLPLCSQSKGITPRAFLSNFIIEKKGFSLIDLLAHHSQPLVSNGKRFRNQAVCSKEPVLRIQVTVLAELTAWYYFKLRFPILQRCQSRQFCFYHFSIYEPSRICSLSIRVHIGYFLSSHLPFFIHFSHKAASILKVQARKKMQSI